jgi:hypothetical protein
MAVQGVHSTRSDQPLLARPTSPAGPGGPGGRLRQHAEWVRCPACGLARCQRTCIALPSCLETTCTYAPLHTNSHSRHPHTSERPPDACCPGAFTHHTHHMPSTAGATPSTPLPPSRSPPPPQTPTHPSRPTPPHPPPPPPHTIHSPLPLSRTTFGGAERYTESTGPRKAASSRSSLCTEGCLASFTCRDARSTADKGRLHGQRYGREQQGQLPQGTWRLLPAKLARSGSQHKTQRQNNGVGPQDCVTSCHAAARKMALTLSRYSSPCRPRTVAASTSATPK